MPEDPITITLNAQSLPAPTSGAEVPDWIHLLPAGPIQTGDRRGPYSLIDAEAVARASLSEGDRLPIDENHATDLAAPKGLPAPARGWIVEMQAREDGVWGRVEWTDVGRDLVSGRAYRGISPVIAHDKAKRVLAVLRASLINKPNLRGLTALNHQEDGLMPLEERLAGLLGLGSDATEDAIFDAVTALQSQEDDEVETALNAQLGQIGVALGLEEGAGFDAVLDAAEAAGDAADDVITALQGELTSVSGELKALKDNTARERAVSFVDGAIKEGRAGVKPQRDRFIAMHMRDPEEAAAIIKAIPPLSGSNTALLPPEATEGEISLNAEQVRAAQMIGISIEDYKTQLAAEQKEAL